MPTLGPLRGIDVHSKSQAISVMMPKIARKILGLTPGTFSRIAIEGNALAFHGQGDEGPVVLPVSMMGTFHHDLLNNLFLYLSNNRQNGILAVTTGPLSKVVFFKKGNIVFAGTTDAKERIGSVLMRLDYVTPEQIAEIDVQDDQRRFGVRVKDAGLITYDQLWEALRVQVVGICCSLVHFPIGNYFFVPDCVPDDSFNHFDFRPLEVLFQSVLRLDEREREVREAQRVASDAPLGVLSSISDD